MKTDIIITLSNICSADSPVQYYSSIRLLIVDSNVQSAFETSTIQSFDAQMIELQTVDTLKLTFFKNE
jgi:hypothetical protein